MLRAFPVVTGVLLSVSLTAADWPQWRGPDRNGISQEKISVKWPAEGPNILWRASVGTGFSSASISDGRVFTMGNAKEKDTIWCFDAVTGKEIWKHTYASELGPKYYEGGPGSTPTVYDGRVYTIGKWGDVFCLDAAKGTVLWQRDLRKDPGAKPNEWGFAGSALIYEDLAIFNAGEAGIAFDRKTGKTVWSNGTKQTGYASPKLFKVKGADQVLLFAQKSMLGLDPKTGKELWSFPWETSWDNSNPDPVLAGDSFLISTYNRGAAFVSLKTGKPTTDYRTDALNQHMSPGVLLGEYLYAFNGQAAGYASDFVCFHLLNGKVNWHEKDLGIGSLIAADNKLIIISEKGELVVAEASPDSFKPLARAQVLGGRCWTSPSLANGLLYLRNAKGDFICADLRVK